MNRKPRTDWVLTILGSLSVEMSCIWWAEDCAAANEDNKHVAIIMLRNNENCAASHLSVAKILAP